MVVGSGWQRINNNEKCRHIAGSFNCHADTAVRRGVHRPMEHIPGFNRSHWMPPLGKCSHSIAAAAVMVKDFGRKYKTQTKYYFYLANLRFTEAKSCENFVPRIGPSTQLINVTSFIWMWNATIGAEELANISSYQMLREDKIWKSY